jgi:hypothetical protein
VAIAYNPIDKPRTATVPSTYPRTTYPIQPNIAPPAAPKPITPMGTAPAPTAPVARPMPANPGISQVGPGSTISEGFGLTPPTPLPPPQQPPPTGVTVPPPSGPPDTGRFTTDFGPGNDLQYQQINPAASDRLKQYQDQLLSYSKGLADTPDRGELAKQAWEQEAAATEPQYQQDLRAVGEKNAALGRIGSGITTSELGDVSLQREKYLGNLQKQLATEAAGQTLQDRLNRLGAGQGLEGQTAAEEAAQRAEVRGERGYQHEVAQEPFQQELQRRAMEDALQNSAFNRQLSAAQLGLTGSELYGQQAEQGSQTSGDLLNQLALEDYLNKYGGGGAQPQGSSPFSFSPGSELPQSPLFPTRNYFPPKAPSAPQFRIPSMVQ